MPKKKAPGPPKPKGKKDEFPYDIAEMLVFEDTFPDLAEHMSNPFRQLTKQASVLLGDGMYALAGSGGSPDQMLAGLLRVGLDNLEAIPGLIKTTVVADMQRQINGIIKDAPPIEE